MKIYLELLIRELKLFSRNTTVIIIFFLAPIIYGVLFGFVYKKGKVTDLPILVIDKDNSPLSNRLLDMLNDNETLIVKKVLAETSNLKQEIIDNGFDAIVIIPERFQASILQRKNTNITVDVNLANILTANYASKNIQVVLATFSAGIKIETMKKMGVPLSNASTIYDPFTVSYVKNFNNSSNYMYFLYPGLLGTILQQVLLLAIALSFSREFEQNTFKTEFLNKLPHRWQALIIKPLIFWIGVIPILIIYLLLFSVFKIPFSIDYGPLIALLYLFIFAVSYLGVIFSILLPSQLKATEFLMVIATPSFVIGGFTWPIDQMPIIIQYIAQIIPLTPFLAAFRKLFMYGASLQDIKPELIHLSVLTVIYFLLSYIALLLKTKKLR
ncbi:MAG: ABC transporter permease [Solitalea-like symbiont of Tyrophagus putrescentiae]